MKQTRLYALVTLLLLCSVNSYAQPNAEFTATVTEACAPVLIQFNAHTSVQGSAYTHSWDMGGTPSALTNPSRLFTTPGQYTIKHTVSGPSGTKTVTKTNFITINQTPTVSFSASPLKGCPPFTVNFTNTSNPGTAGAFKSSWVFGDGGTSTAANPSHTYNTGPNSVTLKIENSKGCIKTVTKTNYIDVYSLPTANFTASKTDFCTGQGTVTFTSTASSGVRSYKWDFGDGNSSTVANPTHTYNGTPPVKYTVKLTVTDSNGCQKEVQKINYIRLHDPSASFTAPASACIGDTVSFTNSSAPTPTAFNWNFDDGSNPVVTANATHVFYQAGTYNVKLAVSYGGCLDTFTKPIVIRGKPNVQLVKSPDTLCPAPQTVNFSTLSPGVTISSFNWDFGNGSSSTLATPSATYTTNSFYQVYLRVTDQYGCKDTLTDTFRIHPLDLFAEGKTETTYAEEDSGCAPLTVDFRARVMSDTNLYPYPVSSYSWDFDDGSSLSSSANPTHTFTDSGIYKVVLTITTAQGCIETDTVLIKVGKKPVADFSGSPRVICADDTVFFSNLSVGGRNFYWQFGDSRAAWGYVQRHAYPIPDTYTVTLIAYDRGCTDTIVKQDYIEVRPAKGMLTVTYNCDSPLYVQFGNASIGDSSHIINFGDGSPVSTAQNVTHKYATLGTYNAYLVAYNNTTGCDDTDRVTIILRDPTTDFSADKTSICGGDTVTFTATMTPNAAPYYQWFVDGAYIEDSITVFKHVFNVAGKHTVMLVSWDDRNCIDTVKKVDYISVSKPDAQFAVDTAIGCAPMTVTFTDNSAPFPSGSIVYRKWSFGTSATDTLLTSNTTVSKVYNLPGSYDVTLLVKDALGCSNSVTYSTIKPHKPLANFTEPAYTCVGSHALFADFSVNAKTYWWSFGDGDTSIAASPSHRYWAKNVYQVTQIVTDSIGCTDTLTKQAHIFKPEAKILMSDSVTICPVLLVNFDGTTSIDAKTYTWDFDNGAQSALPNPSIVFNNPQEYRITLVVTDSLGCTDSDTAKVQVLGFSGAFSYTPLKGCVPMEVEFTSNVKGPVPSLIWDYGDGNTKQGNWQGKIKHTYTTPGKYLPKIVFNDLVGCGTSSDGLDTIYVDEAKADFEVGPACAFSNVQFNNKSAGTISGIAQNYWSFHDGSFSAKVNPGKLYGAKGRYDVLLAVRNVNGCVDTITKEVDVVDPMKVFAGDDTIKCQKDSLILSPTGGVSYQWTPASGLSCTNCPNPKAGVETKTTYTVISTDVNGCHDTDDVVVDIKTHVVSVVGDGGEICPGDTLKLSVSGGETYVWTPQNTLDDNTSDRPNSFPIESTIYTVIAKEGTCIPDTSTVGVLVHPKPTVTVRGEQTILAGGNADLQASGNHIERFEWSPSATLNCWDCSSPIASPYKTTIYTVKVFSDKGCIDSNNVTVTVLCDESQIFIPNTFTPNGDGANDIFYVRGEGISKVESFRIFNRWGEVMFERRNVDVNDKTNGWDGTRNGAALPPDVYVYTVEAYCENGELMKWKGDVTIIR